MKFKDHILNNLIPGGAQTYSKGFDQFPDNAPQILSKGNKQYVYDEKGTKYLDYAMGLRTIILGYNYKEVNQEAIRQILNGNSLPRPSEIELKFSKELIKLLPNIEMVKFAKNGSNAVTGAVKLSRAYNKKKIVLRCKDHPFFSFDDWFIGSTRIQRGVPKEIINLTKTFKYGDINNLKKIIHKYKNKISCLVMEASTTSCPPNSAGVECCGSYKCKLKFTNGYLQNVQKICKENDIIFILDETITGFRWHLKGAAHRYKLDPDLTIYGKAIANGFSMAVLGGKKKIMNEANIYKNGIERTFLLSSTHGGEMCSLGAASATLKILKNKNVIESIWEHGSILKSTINNLIKDFNLEDYLQIRGVPCSPYLETKYNNVPDNKLRTLVLKELIKSRIFMPWISICYSHNNKNILQIKRAFQKLLPKARNILQKSFKTYNVGRIIKPVFRKYN